MGLIIDTQFIIKTYGCESKFMDLETKQLKITIIKRDLGLTQEGIYIFLKISVKFELIH
jgi:hypothetical protein